MRVRFRGFEYLYDTEQDKCAFSSPEGTVEYENPYEGFSTFIGRIEASMRSQLADEITANGRDRWLGISKLEPVVPAFVTTTNATVSGTVTTESGE